jgi:hypothetical protein
MSTQNKNTTATQRRDHRRMLGFNARKTDAAIPGESFTWNYQMTEPEAHEVNR